MSGVKVEGADRLTKTLQAAAADLENLRATNTKVADGIVAAANPPRLTGRLAGSGRGTATDTEAVAAWNIVYAPVQEYGWARRGIRGTHFAANAADSRRNASIDLHKDHVNKAIRQVKGA